jgi:hypothetical protein
MVGNLWKRLAKLEPKIIRPRMRRTILAASAPCDEDLESHDSIRAKLYIQPEPGVYDLVMYCLDPGSPPRLDQPKVWEELVRRPPDATTAQATGAAA